MKGNQEKITDGKKGKKRRLDNNRENLIRMRTTRKSERCGWEQLKSRKGRRITKKDGDKKKRTARKKKKEGGLGVNRLLILMTDTTCE